MLLARRQLLGVRVRVRVRGNVRVREARRVLLA